MLFFTLHCFYFCGEKFSLEYKYMKTQTIDVENKGNKGVEGISKTAHWVAMFRAKETLREDALFQDPWAENLAGELGHEMLEKMGHSKSTYCSITVRTRTLDELLQLALRQTQYPIDAVVNMACGLDTRAFRLELPEKLHWIEIDFPKVIEYKSAVLPKKEQVQYLALDLSQKDLLAQFLSCLEERFHHVLIITEGLLMYLDPEEVENLAKDLSECSSVRFWLQDYYSTLTLETLQGRWSKQLHSLESPMKFALENGPSFYKTWGWKIVEDRKFLKESLRLKRGFPWAKLYVFVSPILPKFLKKKLDGHFRRGSGYVLLENPR